MDADDDENDDFREKGHWTLKNNFRVLSTRPKWLMSHTTMVTIKTTTIATIKTTTALRSSAYLLLHFLDIVNGQLVEPVRLGIKSLCGKYQRLFGFPSAPWLKSSEQVLLLPNDIPRQLSTVHPRNSGRSRERAVSLDSTGLNLVKVSL